MLIIYKVRYGSTEKKNHSEKNMNMTKYRNWHSKKNNHKVTDTEIKAKKVIKKKTHRKRQIRENTHEDINREIHTGINKRRDTQKSKEYLKSDIYERNYTKNNLPWDKPGEINTAIYTERYK